MRHILNFISNNKIILWGMVIGLIAGYLYWYFIACGWGTYPLSAECWTNCAFGCILGGFVASLIQNE